MPISANKVPHAVNSQRAECSVGTVSQLSSLLELNNSMLKGLNITGCSRHGVKVFTEILIQAKSGKSVLDEDVIIIVYNHDV